MAVEGISLPFPEAEQFFAQKVNLPTRRSDDLRHGAHVRGFSVAGMVRDDMLSDIRSALEKSSREGRPFAEFKAAFNEVVDRTGWEFYAPGATEEARRDWRARLIYRTNMRVAYMAGRYKQMTDPDVLKYRPYWRYRHNDSRHPRPQHVAWDGLVLLASDPWWKVHYGPNGWGCLCDAVAINARQMRAMGKTGPDPTPPDGARQGRDPRTGDPETRYDGVDRGWEYNPGEEWLHGAVPRELQEPLPPAPAPVVRPQAASGEPLTRVPDPPSPAPREDLPPLPPPTPASPDRVLPADLPPEDYVSSFLGEFGASLDQGTLHRDASGGIITIDRSLFEQRTPAGEVVGWKAGKRGRGRYALLFADAIREPDEIWLDWGLAGDGSYTLRRSYIRRFVLASGKLVFASYQWSRSGWVDFTAFDASETYALKHRIGALIFRRRSDA